MIALRDRHQFKAVRAAALLQRGVLHRDVSALVGLHECTVRDINIGRVHAALTGASRRRPLKKHDRKLSSGLIGVEEVRLVRNLARQGVRNYEIARQLGCSRTTVSRILSGRRFRGIGLL
jgi:CRP-like cAMP-binding protein